MNSLSNTNRDYTYDRKKFPAFFYFYIPADEHAVENAFRLILEELPLPIAHVARSFKNNYAAVISTASMPFRIISANRSRALFHQLFTAESIRMLKPEFEDMSEQEKIERAHQVAERRFAEAMSSKEHRYEAGVLILKDLEELLKDEEMKAGAGELLRQSEVLAWGVLEALANDLFIGVLNRKPGLTDLLLNNERIKKRFQLRDIALPLSTFGYDLSQHMGDIFGSTVKMDDVETLRAVYAALMPDESEVVNLLRGSGLWKLNQRRNLIVHRRSIVDDIYLTNTGDTMELGTELIISAELLEQDLALVMAVGSAMLSASRKLLV